MGDERMQMDRRCRTKARYPFCELWQPSKTCWPSMLHMTLGRGAVGGSPDFHGVVVVVTVCA
jgi:hypothetical protein